MSRSLARTAVLAALAAVLAVLGVGPALAVTTAPAPGTPECTAAVTGTKSVTDAKTALDSAKQTQQDFTNQLAIAKVATPFLQATVDALVAKLNSQTVTVASAQRVYDKAVAQATKALCTGTAVVTTTTPATPTPEPTSPPVVPAPRVIILPGVLDRNCADFATQADAQAFFLAHGGSPVRNVDNLDANHNGVACEDHFAPVVVSAPQSTTVVTSKTVIATADDGSIATTSGQQVTDVPSGSASTGAA